MRQRKVVFVWVEDVRDWLSYLAYGAQRAHNLARPVFPVAIPITRPKPPF